MTLRDYYFIAFVCIWGFLPTWDLVTDLMRERRKKKKKKAKALARGSNVF